jgi:hypothetical protein
MKKYKRINNDLQNFTQNTKDRSPLKIGVNSGSPEEWKVPAPREHLPDNLYHTNLIPNNKKYVETIVYITGVLYRQKENLKIKQFIW